MDGDNSPDKVVEVDMGQAWALEPVPLAGRWPGMAGQSLQLGLGHEGDRRYFGARCHRKVKDFDFHRSGQIGGPADNRRYHLPKARHRHVR
jgi:hypothetical protein